MTCRSCEVRIERNLRRLPNIERVSASAVHARVEIVSSGPVPAADIAAAIEAAGYEVGRTSWLERDAQVWATAAGGLLVLVLIAVLAQATGIAGLASGAGSLSQGGVVVALLLGLAAGVSTCMALVGGVVLALSAANETRRSATRGDVG
ncbi:MAG TPA: heavy metal-associated domain-containing protein, partial [Candidatus Limnocylindrales bacterium]|nr:heavy metal-associated domain-containing protein [Candidatus Limnocylindrales bacterium]